jgi:hypothetical protein
MRLTELNPKFTSRGGPGITDKDGNPIPYQEGAGLLFNCPCSCGRYHAIDFDIAFDDTPVKHERHFWVRTGNTFNTLTLTPSLWSKIENGGCGWHGHITNGEVTNA